MMMNFTKIFLSFIIVTMLLIFSCGLFQDQSGFANVQIKLGSSGSERSLLDSSPPTGVNITSYTITVTGAGMEPIQETVTADVPFISLLVPAGDDRRFTIEAQLAPNPAIHLLSFIGRETASLKPGSINFLTFKMVAGATKLIIPDYLNNRLIQTSDISFPESPIETGTFGFAVGTLAPIDIDISAEGKIFVASCLSGSPETGVIAFGDDINGTNLVLIDAAYVTAIAIDRENNILYFSTYDGTTATLNKCSLPYNPLDPPTPLENSVVVIGETEPRDFSVVGMDVDPWSGTLYLAAVAFDEEGQPLPLIIHYDPSVQIPDATNPGRVIHYAIHTDFRLIYDVVVKDEAVFVANAVPADVDELPPILKFNKNLSYAESYGRISDQEIVAVWQIIESFEAGDFYGPKRFIAKGNADLTIIDDSAAYDKIVSLDQRLDDSSWKTYPTLTNPAETFAFFE